MSSGSSRHVCKTSPVERPPSPNKSIPKRERKAQNGDHLLGVSVSRDDLEVASSGKPSMGCRNEKIVGMGSFRNSKATKASSRGTGTSVSHSIPGDGINQAVYSNKGAPKRKVDTSVGGEDSRDVDDRFLTVRAAPMAERVTGLNAPVPNSNKSSNKKSANIVAAPGAESWISGLRGESINRDTADTNCTGRNELRSDRKDMSGASVSQGTTASAWKSSESSGIMTTPSVLSSSRSGNRKSYVSTQDSTGSGRVMSGERHHTSKAASRRNVDG